jgi:hypothetical protein
LCRQAERLEVKATIKIRRRGDGVVLTNEGDADWPAGHALEKGLFLCDCNIGGLFAQATGKPNPADGCGADKYAVKITDSTGKVLYADKE